MTTFLGFTPTNIPDFIIESFDLDESKETKFDTYHALKKFDMFFASPTEFPESMLESLNASLIRLGLLEDTEDVISDLMVESKSIKTIIALKHKATSSGIEYKILKQVYQRGIKAHDPTKTTQSDVAAAMARVDDFIKKAKSVSPKVIKESKEPESYEERLKHLEDHPSEVDKLADHIKDLEDIAHHYHDDDLLIKIEEHISREERIKRKIEFMKSKSRRERMRAMALKRLSSPSKINKKARKAAVELIKEKIAKKPIADLTLAEKERLEDMIMKRKDLVNRLARKIAPKIRKIEADRLYKPIHESAGPKGERSDSEDKEEEVIDKDGQEVIVSHSPEAVYSDGGKDDDEVAQ